jgi:LasA protease
MQSIRCLMKVALAAAAVLLSSFSLATSAFVAIDDRDVRWDLRALALDDAVAAIDADPRLAPYRELIIDRAGLHSVSPRFLRVVLNLNEEINRAEPSDATRMAFLLDAAISAAARAYYEGRGVNAARVATSPGLAPLLDLPRELRGLSLAGITLANLVPHDERVQRVSDDYVKLFGLPQRAEDVSSESESIGVSPAAAPSNFLRLPWLVGQTGWSFNGVHSSSGSCSMAACGSPRSSIDFSLGWPAWGANTASARVLAMHEGVVSVISSCNVRVTHASGWATNYYHLSNVQVVTGATVYAGQWIAEYANTQAQALCQGGGSTGPHVHVTLLQNGAQVEMHLSEMSGWRVNAASVVRDYDSDCARMNLSRASITACAYQGSNPVSWSMHMLPAGFPSNTQCSFDVDGNSTPDPLTDGVLLLRYALGFRGANLISGSIGAGATRNTSSLIENYLAARSYDLNVDGVTRTMSDHLLAARLMRGVTGGGLTASLGITSGLLTTPASILEFSRGCR